MSLQFHIRVLKFENKTIDASWGSREHCEPFWRLYMNKSDGASIDLGDETYRIDGGRFHLVPAWVRFRCRNTTTLQHFYIHFEPIGIGSSVQREVFNRPFSVEETMVYDQIAQFPLKNFTPELATDLRSLCYATSIVYRVFTNALLTLNRSSYARLEHLIATDHDFSPVLQHIDGHLAASLSNDILADVAGMSKSHFIRMFHKAMGQTPAEYVQERRVVAAALSLSTSADTIDRIADRCGFANRFYFSRVFAKVMGVSPAAYRSLRAE